MKLRIKRESQAYIKGLLSKSNHINPYKEGTPEHFNWQTAVNEECPACIGLGAFVDDRYYICEKCEGKGYLTA